jgi:hypothetical protein
MTGLKVGDSDLKIAERAAGVFEERVKHDDGLLLISRSPG